MKITIILGVMSVMLLTACKNETPVAPAEPANVPVQARPVAVPTPAPTVPEKSNGTSVKIGSDGINVDTKSGSNSTNVQINSGKASVEVKK